MKHQEDETSVKEIGNRLYLVRTIHGLTQSEFAENASLNQSAYCQNEIGVRKPTVEAAIALCETYDLTLDFIYRGHMDGLTVRLSNQINELVESGFSKHAALSPSK